MAVWLRARGCSCATRTSSSPRSRSPGHTSRRSRPDFAPRARSSWRPTRCRWRRSRSCSGKPAAAGGRPRTRQTIANRNGYPSDLCSGRLRLILRAVLSHTSRADRSLRNGRRLAGFGQSESGRRRAEANGGLTVLMRLKRTATRAPKGRPARAGCARHLARTRPIAVRRPPVPSCSRRRARGNGQTASRPPPDETG